MRARDYSPRQHVSMRMRRFWMVGRQTGRDALHPSGGPLAAVLPLCARHLQFPVRHSLNLPLVPGEHLFRLM